jgi:hypothetical protein
MPWWYARPFYRLFFKGFLLTIVALAAVAWVFLCTGSNMTGLRDYNANTVQLIRERNRLFLIRPEWLAGDANAGGENLDLEWRWVMAEARARCGVVFVLWAAAKSLLIWRYRRRRTQSLPADPPGYANLTGG